MYVKRGAILPINYQYPLSSWIYKCINRADSGFAGFLHEQGYQGAKEGKPFKFFTFSKLHIPRREIYQDRIIIQSPEVYLTLSFLVERAAETFVTGVFQHQHAGIGDAKSQVDFEVGKIEARPVAISTDVQIRTTSPIVVSRPVMENGHRMKAQYLSPEAAGYKALFLRNLVRKYEHYAHFTGNSIPPDPAATMGGTLEKGPVRSRLETIKAGTAAETKVRGYDYRFRLTAPEALVRIGLLAGFGEKNSLGFGCGEVVR